ncbi:MAG: hypothetical protein MJZ82_05435 [Paludibacteraceae bacterium]|nr:hypothetical protein [Paludibacteraceae bacterium]
MKKIIFILFVACATVSCIPEIDQNPIVSHAFSVTQDSLMREFYFHTDSTCTETTVNYASDNEMKLFHYTYQLISPTEADLYCDSTSEWADQQKGKFYDKAVYSAADKTLTFRDSQIVLKRNN